MTKDADIHISMKVVNEQLLTYSVKVLRWWSSSVKLRTAYMRGYTQGIGAMSAKARSEASAKGGSMCASSNDKLGIKWDQQYAEFEEQVGMPEKRSNLHLEIESVC